MTILPLQLFLIIAGAVEIAAVGVSIAIFNQASKVTIFPLVNITTSFVAEEDTVRRISEKEAKADLEKGKMEKNDSTKQLILTGDNYNDKTETKETVLAPGISYEFNFYTLTIIFLP